MQITHIFHSGFSVELSSAILIFDWYTGSLPAFSGQKPVFCFVSHGHGDHYGNCIWTLREKYADVHYLLDRNVPVPGAGLKTGAKLPRAAVTKVRPHKHYEIGGICVDTLLSTDQGVAFVVEAEGKTIYHAGDLNIWYWEGEPERENNWQVGTYRKEISRIADRIIDLAFVPVDPRLEAHGADGAAAFLEMVECRRLVPMHYWEQASASGKYLEDTRLKPWRDRITYLPDGCTQSGIFW